MNTSHKLCLLALALCASCSSTAERPACSPATLAAIEAHFVANVLAQCSAYQRPEDCPAYPGLQADRKAETDRWVQCR